MKVLQPSGQENPPAFCPDDVHKRRPERLDYPRKVEEACVESHIGIVHPQILEHNHGDDIHYEIGYALGEIQGRDPEPRVGLPGAGRRREKRNA